MTMPTDPSPEAARRYELRDLDALFAPKTVAVICPGGKEGSAERTILSNLINYPFGGTVYPIHPQKSSVLGIKAYPLIAATPEPIDLAVIACPAPNVPRVVGECVDASVKTAIIISAGFRETGAAGLELERQVLEQTRRG